MDKPDATTDDIASPASRPAVRLRTIGYWVDDDRPDLPDPSSLIDEGWDPEQRRLVASYLSAGREVAIGQGCSPCRICGAPNGFEEFTDGTYLWPEGLAHYVLDHSVRLPDEVIRHAVRLAHSTTAVGLVSNAWWTAATS